MVGLQSNTVLRRMRRNAVRWVSLLELGRRSTKPTACLVEINLLMLAFTAGTTQVVLTVRGNLGEFTAVVAKEVLCRTHYIIYGWIRFALFYVDSQGLLTSLFLRGQLCSHFAIYA